MTERVTRSVTAFMLSSNTLVITCALLILYSSKSGFLRPVHAFTQPGRKSQHFRSPPFAIRHRSNHGYRHSIKRPSPIIVFFSDSKEADDALEEESPQNDDDIDAFGVLAQSVVSCLQSSDLKRMGGFDGGSTGWTSWVEDASALRLKTCIDKLCLETNQIGSDRDEANSWMRWMKNTPGPLVVELSGALREEANRTMYDDDLKKIDTTREDFLARMGCRLILLPSAKELQHPFRTPPGGMAYGKLLYGGVRRFRILASTSNRSITRRTGERIAIQNKRNENISSWLQFGGPERKYEAMNVGPAAVLEVIILPVGLTLPCCVFGKDEEEMALSKLDWEPQSMFTFAADNNTTEAETDTVHDTDAVNGAISIYDDNFNPDTLHGKELNDAFETSFVSSVGGLQTQIQSIIQRVLDGRVIQPSSEDSKSASLSKTTMEAQELASLGLTPIKGLLLYGPPGCGKTALAREISNCLQAYGSSTANVVPPKIISSPELMDRWVGGSERLIRDLFYDAEQELIQCNGDASQSALHVIVLDEIDAVFRKRSSSSDSGETARASAVNQILSKLDGVTAIPNVLVIGMTNRRELLDEALLRPGRLEVHVEIPLPTKKGRWEILRIHFQPLRESGKLSQPLLRAIDGVYSRDQKGIARHLSWYSLKRRLGLFTPTTGKRQHQFVMDLSDDAITGGYSGADIAGLVRCAGSIALSRARKDGSGIDGLLITLEDVLDALVEMKS